MDGTGDTRRARPQRESAGRVAAALKQDRAAASLKQDKVATVERIVSAAGALLADRSIDQVGMREIAEAANVRRTALYYYFSTVTEVYQEVARRQIELSYESNLQRILERKPQNPDQLLEMLVDAATEFFNTTPAAYKTLFSFGPQNLQVVDPNYDIVCARLFHAAFNLELPVEKLSEQDPFRTVSVFITAAFLESVRRHGLITPFMAEQAKIVSKAYLAAFMAGWADPS